jgi:hypothetical protein
MAKRKINLLSAFKQITGLSTPVAGIQWIPPTDEGKIVRAVVRFLEDRRALYVPHDLEIPLQVTNSVIAIRERITKAIEELPEDSRALPALRAMRSACRRFLNCDHLDFRHLSHHDHSFMRGRRDDLSVAFLVSLGELRASFGHWLLHLGAIYNLEVEEELASILPPEEY